MARILATVVFTDIVGSTQLRSDVGDDEADRLVALHDTAVGEIVPAHGGRVVKYLGDGALAVFTSAVDATEAASAILGHLAESSLSVKVGVHAGDVESDGDDVAGMPVAIASRLCSVAPAGGVVVSGLVRSLVGVRGDLHFESMGTPTLKGVDEPIEAWLVDRGQVVDDADPSRLPPPVIGRQLGTFVGRSMAIAALDRALDAVGRQFLVAVSGEPGIGKTALVGHWAGGAHNRGITVLVGSSPPEGVAPYQPFIDAIRPLLRNDSTLRPRGAGAANLARLMPELAGASTGTPLLDDPKTERYVINEAFVELLGNAADRHGRLILVLDDLHWADEASLALLGHLLRHRRDVPVLVVGTYRDTDLDRRHPLSDLLRDQRRDRRADRLDLSGLDAAEVTSLVTAVAGGTPPDAALEVIISETEGNPFFIEEIVEHLVSEGMVVDGTWDFDPRAAMTIPEGIRDTIGRRLDRLSNTAQELLAAGAVIGTSFDVAILMEVDDSPVVEVEAALEEAIAAGFVSESGTGEVSFSHALIRQTILDEISHLRRSRLHRAAGEALAGAGAPADRLVHHWIEAREYPRALDASLRAMRDAVAVAAHAAAAVHADTALELWDEVRPEDRPPGAERHQAITAGGLAIAMSQGSREGVEYLRDHRSTLEAAGDERGVGVVLAEEARHLWPLGLVEEARAEAERALELIPETPATPERARAEAQLARLLMLNGSDDHRALVVSRQALDTSRAAGDPLTETAVLITLGICEPEPEEGEVLLRKGLELATAQNATFQITRARTNLAELLSGQGRYEEAIDLMKDGLDLMIRLGIRGQSHSWMIANLAENYYNAGRWSEAMSVLGSELSPGYPEAIQLSLMARVNAHRGNFEEAVRLVERVESEYGHITDTQLVTPLVTTRLWLARWTGDAELIPPSAFDHSRLPPRIGAAPAYTTHYLVAASETAAALRASGARRLEGADFAYWMTIADQIRLEPLGGSLRATLDAERRRFEARDDPVAWSEAVVAWGPGRFEHAVATLGLLRATAGDSGARPSRSRAQATEVALATADTLGAAPLAVELRRYSGQ